MRKYIVGFFLSIILIFVLFYSFTQIKAQETTEVQIKNGPVELGIEAVYEPCEDPTDSLCVPYPDTITSHPDLTNIDHELGLTADDLPANTDIYIVGCISTNNNIRCTTGDTSLDTKLNAITGGDQMNPDPTHSFKSLENPKKTNAVGVLETVIVRSYTEQQVAHFFYGYYIDTQGSETEKVTIIPTSQAIKQGTFDFETATPSPTARPKVKRQNYRLHDPKGRLFDIKSLEPISEGEVTLLNNLKKIFIYEGVTNPQRVKINGEFNFWVPNGIYYLNLSQKPNGYNWPVKLENVNANYLKAYYCDSDVKNEKNQSVPLYLDQYSIIENNKLVHCDVPLNPGTNAPYRSDVQTVDFTSSRSSDGLSTFFTGRVTHPLTVVNLKGRSTGKVIASKTADKLGFWTITIQNSNYPLKTDGNPDQMIASYKKTDLTNTLTNITEVEGTIYEPILSSIEGYTYDETGQVLPNAKVGFKQQGNEKIVYITTADSTGFFKIPTQYLPSFSYELVFLSQTSKTPVVYSTSQFITKNSDYLLKNKINLLTKTNKELLGVKLISNNFDDYQVKTKNDTSPQTSKNSNKQLIPIIIILTVAAIVAIVALIILIKKNKNQPPPSPLL